MSKYVPKDLVDLFVNTWNNHNSLRKCTTRDRINCGWCYQFALVLKRLHGERVQLWRDHGHAWVKIGDKFYDSNFPLGVKNYLDLRITSTQDLKQNLTEEEFIMSWRVGGSGPVQLDVIENTVRAYKMSMDIGA